MYQQDLDHKWNDHLANLFAFVIVPLKVKVFHHPSVIHGLTLSIPPQMDEVTDKKSYQMVVQWLALSLTTNGS